jgi:hypothetical protein
MSVFRNIVASLVILAGLLGVGSPVYAADVISPVCTQTPDATLCKDNEAGQTADCNALFGPCGVLTKAAKLLTIVVAIASVIMIIIGGIQYVISSGDPTNIGNAKNTILYAIIGLVIALLARGIISFVLVKL